MNKREVGSDKEKIAAEQLTAEGYRIIKTNFFCNAGEIDIIAEEKGYLCFIEVKYRAGTEEGYPEEAVGPAKIKRISRSAQYYMNRYGYSEYTPCRFDVVSILGDRVKIIRDAFDAIL